MLIWPILKPSSLEKRKLVLDSNITLSVLFLSPSTLIGTSVIDCQLHLITITFNDGRLKLPTVIILSFQF